MNRSLLTITTVLSLTATMVPVAHSATFHQGLETTMFSGHSIRVDVRNETAAVIGIKAGDQSQTVEPKATLHLKLVAGTQVSASTPIGEHTKAGEVIFTASSELDGNTVVLH